MGLHRLRHDWSDLAAAAAAAAAAEGEGKGMFQEVGFSAKENPWTYHKGRQKSLIHLSIPIIRQYLAPMFGE